MIRKTITLLILSFAFCAPCFAQFYPTQYRPPDQNWQYLQTPHFKLVYGEGNYASALQMARILETQYPLAQQLVGGNLENFPVILNDYNDRSNGFVSPLHFRAEIELPPIKGKTLNPQTGNWLWNVGPHELVHALQFSHWGDFNITQLVSLFSPDLARSFHGAIPAGMLEGIATYHETVNVAPDGGRGNLPIFTNWFDATFTSDLRWSMGQLMQNSANTRPFNRHYIGGYEFTAWLQQEFGPSTTREALNFYVDFPFLGYGVALRHETGLWPGELYNRFEDFHEKRLEEKPSLPQIGHLPIPFEGAEIRRPKWLSDSTLIFHGSFYNARPGFYSYQLNSGEMERLITTGTIGDFQYDLSADHSKMIFSYLEPSTLYDNTYKAELVAYNFETGQKQQLTDDGRMYAPVFRGDGLLALQTRPASSRLVSIETNAGEVTSIDEVLYLPEFEIIAVADNPVSDRWAVIANKDGMQALWITTLENIKDQLQQAPDISFESGAVYDPVWHPGGEKLLFSSDFSGVHQLYEYDLEDGAIIQITNASFNAFEGAYSRDGGSVAFIKQVENKRLPAILERNRFEGSRIPAGQWVFSEDKISEQPAVPDSILTASESWETGDYSPGLNWLKPRTVLPVFEEVSSRDVYQWGLAFHSNNLLQSQAYSAEITYLEDRLWYDLNYQNKTFYPGFEVSYFSEPSYGAFNVQDPSGKITTYSLLQQERGLALSVPFQFQLNQNVFFTSLFIEPEIRRSQIRFFEMGTGDNQSEFAGAAIANIYGQFNFRLQQNIRDLQPNSGLILYAELEHYLSSDSINFTAYGYNLPISLNQKTALTGGAFTYFSPFRRLNQSLRVGVEWLTQSGVIYDNQSLVSNAFSVPVFETSNNLLSFSTRYTIPLFYVDDGGFLVPLYLSNVYLVGFTSTVTDPTFENWIKGSRSVFGLGIRARFRLSNLAFDIGVGFGFEPTRGNTEIFIGDF
ncbi:MAG TPA: hypothetical protein VFG39_08865 [Balneolaceae bacterium]|nr:hypothetical protein [Balneolaceae bacterium]